MTPLQKMSSLHGVYFDLSCLFITKSQFGAQKIRNASFTVLLGKENLVANNEENSVETIALIVSLQNLMPRW